MRKPTIYYRLSGYAWIVTGAFHLVGQLISKEPANRTEIVLFDLMRNYEKPVAGGFMTMKDIQDGLSLFYSLFLISTGITAILLLKHSANDRVTYILAAVQAGVAFTGMMISFRYFFWLPVISFAFILQRFSFI